MKGHADVIKILNDVLTAELTAINQYFVHAEMCANWGYKRLYAQIRKEAISEMKHAEALIERVLYLEGVPNVQRLGVINIGETVKEQLDSDLKLEYDAVERLNPGVIRCRELNDAGSAMLLEKILAEEEEHVDWIEAQIEAIKQMGIENYLAQQLGEGEED
ncbi:MAG: bacterioferritin [Acidobacteria bacterium]|nr:bacterioferritin [Acidobacteriota bacterium]